MINRARWSRTAKAITHRGGDASKLGGIWARGGLGASGSARSGSSYSARVGGWQGYSQDRKAQPGYCGKYPVIDQRLPSVNNRHRGNLECEDATGEPTLIAKSATFSCTLRAKPHENVAQTAILDRRVHLGTPSARM